MNPNIEPIDCHNKTSIWVLQFRPVQANPSLPWLDPSKTSTLFTGTIDDMKKTQYWRSSVQEVYRFMCGALSSRTYVQWREMNFEYTFFKADRGDPAMEPTVSLFTGVTHPTNPTKETE